MRIWIIFVLKYVYRRKRKIRQKKKHTFCFLTKPNISAQLNQHMALQNMLVFRQISVNKHVCLIKKNSNL